MLVIGNGPVGQTTALLLARWGVPVVVLDARPGRDHVGSKAICQQRDVLDVWCSVGAGAIAREGLTWARARTFYRDRELFVDELPDPGRSPLPPFVNISQSRTEEVLDAAIAQQPTIEVRWGHEVVDVHQDAQGVTLTCRTADGQVQVWGGYAVACAGARASSLRDLLGVDFPGRSFDDAFLICDVRAELPGWEQERRFYFEPDWNPGRQVLIHPCPDGVYRIDWQVEPGFNLTAATRDGSLARRIEQVVGGPDYELVWSSVYRFHSRQASGLRSGRVFLAGDVAHLVAPFGARGLNSGVADADNLAWKLAFVLRGWADDRLLDSYHTERAAAAAENVAVTTATMDFLVPRSPEAAERRHALLEAAVRDPALRAQIDSGRLAEPFWYVDSPLTTPDPTRPWPGRPPRGQPPAPVPGVALPDVPVRGYGAASRVREAVRSGLTILAPDASTGRECEEVVRAGVRDGTPLRVLDLSAVDGTGVLRDALECGAGDVWLVRPDAHTAARVDGASALIDAVDRVLATPRVGPAVPPRLGSWPSPAATPTLHT